jgi:hypothetical protein
MVKFEYYSVVITPNKFGSPELVRVRRSPGRDDFTNAGSWLYSNLG